MTDNEIKREKTFNEELLHFKERIQEVFDNYDNPNGNEDPLYICVLRDSKRVVRKAQEEIAHQQAEIEKLQKEIQITKDAYVMLQTKMDIIKATYKEFADKLKELDGYYNHIFDDCATLLVSDEYIKGRYEKINEIWSTTDNLLKQKEDNNNDR